MTKKEMFAEIRNRVADNAEMVTFIDHEIELLSRKRTSTKPTKTQIANEALKVRIAEVLGNADEPMTIKEIVGELGDEGLTPQKMSALLKGMGAHKEIVKGKALFSLE